MTLTAIHVTLNKRIKIEGKRLLGRPRCRWEDNIRLDLREIRSESVECMHLAQYRDQ